MGCLLNLEYRSITGVRHVTWADIARKDIRDATRDGTLQWYAGLLTLLTIAISYGHVRAGAGNVLIADLAGLLTVVIPFAAILVAHESIAFELEIGRMRTTLSLPHSRTAVVVGYAAGRATLTGVAVASALVGAAGVTLVFGAPLFVHPFLGYSIGTILLGVVFAVIGVGISASTRSTTIALLGGVVVVLLSLGWPAILSVAWSSAVGGPMPGWLETIGGWDPVRAYAKTVVLFAGTGVGALGTDNSWIGLPLLGGWAVFFLGVGVQRFTTMDL